MHAHVLLSVPLVLPAQQQQYENSTHPFQLHQLANVETRTRELVIAACTTWQQQLAEMASLHSFTICVVLF
jgi:competence CoiA-like predicted nuclease